MFRMTGGLRHDTTSLGTLRGAGGCAPLCRGCWWRGLSGLLFARLRTFRRPLVFGPGVSVRHGGHMSAPARHRTEYVARTFGIAGRYAATKEAPLVEDWFLAGAASLPEVRAIHFSSSKR